MNRDRSQHNEEQGNATKGIYLGILGLRDQEREQEEEREMQAYLNAKKPAYRNGPSSNQGFEKYSLSQFFIVRNRFGFCTLSESMMLVGVIMLMLGIDCVWAAIRNVRPAPWKKISKAPVTNERPWWAILGVLFLAGGSSVVMSFLAKVLRVYGF